jgi:hypothetical protein
MNARGKVKIIGQKDFLNERANVSIDMNSSTCQEPHIMPHAPYGRKGKGNVYETQ